MQPLITKRVTYAALAALVMGFVVMPISKGAFFYWELTKAQQTRELVFTSGAAVFYFLAAYAIQFFVGKVKTGQRNYREWLAFSGGYFALMLVLLALIWPGEWVLDDINVAMESTGYADLNWQNFVTNFYHTLAMFTYPSAISVLIFQLIVLSCCMGYLMTKAREFLPGRWWVVAVLPFFALPILYNNMYPLRMTLWSYLFATMLVFLYSSWRASTIGISEASRLQRFAVVSMFLIVLSNWRSEGIILLALFPLAFLVIYRPSGRIFTKARVALALVAAVVFGAVWGYGTTASTPQYNVPTIVNPLSIMVHQLDSRDDHDLAVIGKVIDLKILRENPSFTEIPSYWLGVSTTQDEQKIKKAGKSFIKIVARHPAEFLRTRTNTFLATNGVGQVRPFILFGTLTSKQSPYTATKLMGPFLTKNPPLRPWNDKLKIKVTGFLMQLSAPDYWTFTPAGRVIWNSMIPMAILFMAAIGLLTRRKVLAATLVATPLVIASAVFLTAPANFFFYYLPQYLCGYYVGAVALGWLGSKLFKANRGRDTVTASGAKGVE